jgi:hypothetical protein
MTTSGVVSEIPSVSPLEIKIWTMGIVGAYHKILMRFSFFIIEFIGV